MAEQKTVGTEHIEIKNRKEYLELDDKEKNNWVIYNPASSGDEYNKLVEEMTALKSCLDDIKFTYENMKSDPLMMKSAQYAAITSCFALLIDALKPILKLINDSIVGVLVKPLVEFLKLLLKVLGSIVMLICTTAKQAWLNGKAIVDNLEQIDYDGIFVENFKKATGSKSEAEIDWDLIAMKKEEKIALEKELKMWKTQLEVSDAWQKMVKARKAELLQQSIDSLCETLMKPWTEVLDIEWKKLIGYDQEALDKIVPNPALASGAIAKKLNKLAENKYIQKKDLAGIELYYKTKKAYHDNYMAMVTRFEELEEKEKDKLESGEITKKEYDENMKALSEEKEKDKKEVDTFFKDGIEESKKKMQEFFKMTNAEYEKKYGSNENKENNS